MKSSESASWWRSNDTVMGSATVTVVLETVNDTGAGDEVVVVVVVAAPIDW